MQGVEWSVGAELQRDLIRLELSPQRLRRFEKALGETLEQIQRFNESAPKSPISRMGREDIRRIIFDRGYSLTYILHTLTRTDSRVECLAARYEPRLGLSENVLVLH